MWCAAFAAAAGAAGSASAQRLAVTELQAGVSGALAHRDFWGAEVGIAWRPHEPYHCFAVDVESAGFLRFGGTDPEREEIWSWRAGGALTKRTAEVNV